MKLTLNACDQYMAYRFGINQFIVSWYVARWFHRYSLYQVVYFNLLARWRAAAENNHMFQTTLENM